MRPLFVYGTAWKKERTKDLVTLALKTGFRAIDTANQPKHYYEAGVGEALADFFQSGGKRTELFIQTKFTPVDGQDSRIPYDHKSSLLDQVCQSFESSLNHLRTDYLDSYLLHGPYHYPGLGEEDFEVWKALEGLFQSNKVKSIGVSNFNAQQLEELLSKASVPPQTIQNRCFAKTGWDFRVRQICKAHSIDYQGFSLLTANPEVFHSKTAADMASRHHLTISQLVFKFSQQLGMIPLTGTSDPIHMKEDLDLPQTGLSPEEIDILERLAL